MVVILLGHGFEESEAIVPADLLRRAGVQVVLAALEGTEVTSSHGVTVKADATLNALDADQIDLLFLPGGLGGVEAIQSCPAALELIRAVYGKGKYLSAICAAPTILGSMGLLEGRRAVCYPGMEDGLTGAKVQKGCGVVVDGSLITGEAAGSAFEFGLKLVELLKGSAAAQQVKDAVHYHY